MARARRGGPPRAVQGGHRAAGVAQLADSLFGNLCVDGTIASYLETGKLPPHKPRAEWDITCQPLPIPNLTAQTAAPASMPANSAAARAAR